MANEDVQENISTKSDVYEDIKPEYNRSLKAWTVEGREFDSKERAQSFADDVNKLARKAWEDTKLADVIPAEYRNMQIEDRNLKFRNSLYELPMNEPRYPSGEINPMYDNEYYYGWAADRSDSIGGLRQYGYRMVTEEEMHELIERGKMPDMYRSLLEVENGGNALRMGTEILMRIPRFLRKQNILNPKIEAAKNASRITDRKNYNDFGVDAIRPDYNEVEIKI